MQKVVYKLHSSLSRQPVSTGCYIVAAPCEICQFFRHICCCAQPAKLKRRSCNTMECIAMERSRRMRGEQPSVEVIEESALMKLRPLYDHVVVERIDSEPKPPAALSFRTPPGKNRRKVKLSPSARAAAMRSANSSLSTSRSATTCYSANGRARRSRSTARIS